jgi:hypothetical protein
MNWMILTGLLLLFAASPAGLLLLKILIHVV